MNGDIGQLRFTPSRVEARVLPRAYRETGEPADVDAGRFGARPEVDSVHLSSVPPAPPEDVLAEIQRARTRAEELIAANRELHFAKDEVTGRIIVEVRDARGEVLRTIPPSRALAVMDGSAGLD